MNTQKIFSTTMLDFLLTSKGSVNTVYNKVIVNMQCHIIFASLGLIYTTGKENISNIYVGILFLYLP